MDLCRRLSIPFLGLGLYQIDSAQEQGQIFVSDLHGGLVGGPAPAEPAFLQALGADPEPGAVPHQELDAVARGVAKNIDVTRGGIGLELMFDDRVQAVEGLAHVGGAGDDKNASGGTERDHCPGMESVRRSRANRQGDLIEDHSRLPSLASDDDPRGQLDRNQTVAGQRREGEFDDWLRANCSIAVGSPGTAQPVGQSGNADPIGFTKSPLRPTAGVVGIQESGALPRGMSFCHPPFSLGTVPALDGLDWTLTLARDLAWRHPLWNH